MSDEWRDVVGYEGSYKISSIVRGKTWKSVTGRGLTDA